MANNEHTRFACQKDGFFVMLAAKGGANMRRLILIIVLAFSGILAFLLGRCVREPPSTVTMPTDQGVVAWTGEQDLQQPEVEQEMIAIPGYESMTFSADSVKQKVNLWNPETNTCLFHMRLLVGEEQIWESDFVKPGYGFYEIDLAHPLTVGEYGAYLVIECFREDGTALNSAKVKFDLFVQ